MQSFLLFALLVISLVAIFALSKRRLIRNAVVVLLFLMVSHVLFFASGSVRSHAELAKKQAQPFAYIEGLAHMYRSMVPVRAKAGVASLGLFIIALVAINARQRKGTVGRVTDPLR